MDWTKIPTTLITKRYSDYEISCIVKFQLVWAMNEEQPDEKTCLRYMTKKQYQTAMTYVDSISSIVGDGLSSVKRKREAEKIRYNKIKHLDNFLPADCKQTGSSLPSQIRLDKIREDNIPPVSRDTVPQRVTRFQKPTIDEIRVYCSERNNGINAESFYDFYESKGWKVGSSPMKDWKAAVRTWEKKKAKEPELEPMILIEEGVFYLDSSMKEYQDLFVGVANPDDLALSVWKWVFKNFEGKRVKISFIRSMIEKFKNGMI